MSSGPVNQAEEVSPRNVKPVSTFPKQAVVVIHGMGEQMPMDTIKGFVRAVWETDAMVTANGLPNPAEVWSKPDVRTGSLELRRITTRQSIPTRTFSSGVRSDFYELYWADLSGGSTWSQVQDWIAGLLLRNPFSRVPYQVLPAWIILWIAALIVILLAIATALPITASIGSFRPWEYPPLKWLSGFQAWQLALATALLGAVTHWFVVPYFGRVARYTRAKPENIAARKDIRERGLALLVELHKGEYERIIIVGHSLGSIVAYELVSYFWASRPESHTVEEGRPEFAALRTLEQASSKLADKPPGTTNPALLDQFLDAQREFCRLLRLRPKSLDGRPDTRWLITDLVTLGSPLTHAQFLLAKSDKDLNSRKKEREFPTSPPVRELLDPPLVAKAQAAGFAIDPAKPQLSCFPLGPNDWQLHHAAAFAAVRWTNIFDPARFVLCGDIISGAIAPVFGAGVIDVDLRKLRGQSGTFTHTQYWPTGNKMLPKATPQNVIALREALDLAGQSRLL
jgi:hypothetical protein